MTTSADRTARRLETPDLVWLVLVAATAMTALVGLEQSAASTAAGLVLLAVAFVKVRLVGIHFMELGNAPTPLRLLFEGYAVGVFAVLVVLYLVL